MKALLIGAAHATELPYVWGTLGSSQDMTLKLGGVKGAKAVSSGSAPGGRTSRPSRRVCPVSRTGRRIRPPTRACLVIDHRDKIRNDIDADIRIAWGEDPLHLR